MMSKQCKIKEELCGGGAVTVCWTKIGMVLGK